MKKYLSTSLNRFLIWNQRRCYHVSRETLFLDKWWKLQDTNDWSHLAKKEYLEFNLKIIFDFLTIHTFKIDIRKDYSFKSSKMYETILNQFIQAGGFGKLFIKLCKMRQKWVDLRSEWLLTGNMTVKMDSIFLGVDIGDMEKVLDEFKGSTREDSLVEISERMGGGFISPSKITLSEYQTHLSYYGKKR